MCFLVFKIRNVIKKAALNYFYSKNSKQFFFFRIPHLSVMDIPSKCLSTDAKQPYGLLLDPTELSAPNGWYHHQGFVFIYQTLQKMQDGLNCCYKKPLKFDQKVMQAVIRAVAAPFSVLAGLIGGVILVPSASSC
ncbi:replication initiator protein A [Oscillibacter sp. GMB15532]|uniref:replication initiator protein A n=1 Tax=Oscillibacter sp. GMB15532 TaxID=3230022 RepID=UPI0034DE7D41